MIGVIIPAHNEARCIGPCVLSVIQAARHPALRGEAVRIIVVLDSCTDEASLHSRWVQTYCLFRHAMSGSRARRVPRPR